MSKARVSALKKLNEKGAIQFIILALLLVGIIVGVFLITNGNPLKLFTRATTPPIVFKATDGSALPKDSNDIPVSSSPNVKVELTSPLGPPAGGPSAPVSAPNQRKTVSYKIAEEAANLNSAISHPYNLEPTSFLYTFPTSFNPCGSDQKFIWVEFRASDGSIDRRTAQIKIEVVCPTPTPAPTPTASPVNVGIGTTAPERSIKITYPNGGEVFNVGDKVRITWTSNKIDQVNLGYSFGPGSLNPITSFISSQDYYDWVVNIGNTNNTKVKIDVLGYGPEGQSNDQSDDFFTVNPAPAAPIPPPAGGPGGSSGGGGGGSSPTQPVIKTISQVRAAESPTNLQTALWKPYTQGMVLSHTFIDASPGEKFIFVQFSDNQGQIIKINGQDYIQSSITLEEPQATPPPNIAPPPPPAPVPQAPVQNNGADCPISHPQDFDIGTLKRLCYPSQMIRIDLKYLNDFDNQTLIDIGRATGDLGGFLANFTGERLLGLPPYSGSAFSLDILNELPAWRKQQLPGYIQDQLK